AADHDLHLERRAVAANRQELAALVLEAFRPRIQVAEDLREARERGLVDQLGNVPPDHVAGRVAVHVARRRIDTEYGAAEVGDDDAAHHAFGDGAAPRLARAKLRLGGLELFDHAALSHHHPRRADGDEADQA